MNAIEMLMMNKLADAVQNHSDPIDAASVLASQEALDIIAKVNPAKVHGIIVIAVEAAEPNEDGEGGVALTCSMAGAPTVLHALSDTTNLMLRASALQEQMDRHPLGQVLKHIMGDSMMQSEKAQDRFSSAGKSTQ